MSECNRCGITDFEITPKQIKNYLGEDFINKNQIMAYYGKDDTGVFEVRFSVKEQ